MDELKPCPFCGNHKTPAHSPPDTERNKNYHDVLCTGCLAAGPPERSKEAAIESWNRRHI